jgi:hypothetical protein
VEEDPQLVALASAAASVYEGLIGGSVHDLQAGERDEILNWVAHATANLVPVYVPDVFARAPRELTSVELVLSSFQRGATTLRTKTGVEYRGLTVRRSDVQVAISILKRAPAPAGVASARAQESGISPRR